MSYFFFVSFVLFAYLKGGLVKLQFSLHKISRDLRLSLRRFYTPKDTLKIYLKKVAQNIFKYSVLLGTVS